MQRTQAKSGLATSSHSRFAMAGRIAPPPHARLHEAASPSPQTANRRFRDRFLEIGFPLVKCGSMLLASTALALQLARSNQLAYEIGVAATNARSDSTIWKNTPDSSFAIEFLVERFEPFAHAPTQTPAGRREQSRTRASSPSANASYDSSAKRAKSCIIMAI